MKWIFLISICLNQTFALIDPISISIGAGLSALGYYNYEYVKNNTYCQIFECCNDLYINSNMSGLLLDLKTNVYGQHILIEQLVSSLAAHISSPKEQKKPLVISFHGTTGTGKNFVTDFIAKNLYKKGLKSNYIHKYYGRTDFPLSSKVSQYKEDLIFNVKKAIKRCPRSLFIFDEVHTMPFGLLDSIASLMDYHEEVAGFNFRESIFIFLTNTGGYEISNKLGELMKSGVLREKTTVANFEIILETISFNVEGGFKRSGIISETLIDHFIPFLPLEKKHIEKCIRAEYGNLTGRECPSQLIQHIIDSVVVFDNDFGLFATTGCKRINKKVAAEVFKEKLTLN